MTDNNNFKVNVEITDTYGGEANYSWVNRWTFTSDKNLTNRQILKKIRDHFGISCRLKLAYDAQDLMRYNFNKQCVCMFITFGRD